MVALSALLEVERVFVEVEVDRPVEVEGELLPAHSPQVVVAVMIMVLVVAVVVAVLVIVVVSVSVVVAVVVAVVAVLMVVGVVAELVAVVIAVVVVLEEHDIESGIECQVSDPGGGDLKFGTGKELTGRPLLMSYSLGTLRKLPPGLSLTKPAGLKNGRFLSVPL